MPSDLLNNRVERNEKRLDSHSKRLKWLEKEQVSIAKDSERLEEILLELKAVVEKLDISINALQMQPAKEYQSFKGAFVGAVITALVALAVNYFF